MEKDKVYENFIEIIRNKIPERGKLANILLELLNLEKEAVYRRLRGEVPFTFSEIVTICKEFNISLDNIIGTTSGKTSSFQMRMIDFDNPAEEDFIMQEHYASILDVAKNDPESESSSALNLIPINLCLPHHYLYRFERFKWIYQFSNQPRKYADVQLSERLRLMNYNSTVKSKHIGRTYFIWDEQIIPSIVNDVRYFTNIRFIEKEEMELIKQDLLHFLDDLEAVAIKGGYEETGKAVHLFISGVNIDTSFTYIQTQDYHITNIRSFSLTDTISLDKNVLERIKKWMQSLIHTSTLISGSNEIQRLLFFERQREYVNSL